MVTFPSNCGMRALIFSDCAVFKIERNECVRPGVSYALGGYVCKAGEPSSEKNRIIEETLLAVNICGLSQVDFKGVLHQTAYVVKESKSINSLDKNIYSTFIKSVKENGTYCQHGYFTLTKDGRYEIAIKVSEPYYHADNKRVRRSSNYHISNNYY